MTAATAVGGTAAVAPAAVLAEGATSGASQDGQIHWDHEVDLVIAGGCCAGLTAAIRARDSGTSVLVVDRNFDLGGRMLHSGSYLSLGGGDAIQLRDMAGAADAEGFITVPPAEDPAEMDDNVELLFTDVTDRSVVDGKAQSPSRCNEREMMRAWAGNFPPPRRGSSLWTITSASPESAAPTAAAAEPCQRALLLLDAGRPDRYRGRHHYCRGCGVADPERTSPFAPVQMEDAASFVGPNALRNGVALARPLEYSARKKDVMFILNRRFTDLIREKPFEGRVIGLKANYSPRINPDTTERLESFWQNGSIDDRREADQHSGQGGDDRFRRSCGESGIPQHVLSGFARTRFPHFGFCPVGAWWSGRERDHCRAEGGCQSRMDAAEFVLSYHLSHLAPTGHS